MFERRNELGNQIFPPVADRWEGIAEILAVRIEKESDIKLENFKKIPAFVRLMVKISLQTGFEMIFGSCPL